MIIPDISFYQNNPDTHSGIDFQTMREATPAVIIRAGQYTWKDPSWDYNWREAGKAGLMRGSYWYYDNRGDPKRQAELWCKILNGEPELGMWCDFEDRYNMTATSWRKWYVFMERIKVLRPGSKLGIYTGYYYWQEFAAGQKYFSQYPLWIAAYKTDKPRVPPIWKDWTIWQYTDSGDGGWYGVISKSIDLNYVKDGLLPDATPTGPTMITAHYDTGDVKYVSDDVKTMSERPAYFTLSDPRGNSQRYNRAD